MNIHHGKVHICPHPSLGVRFLTNVFLFWLFNPFCARTGYDVSYFVVEIVAQIFHIDGENDAKSEQQRAGVDDEVDDEQDP